MHGYASSGPASLFTCVVDACGRRRATGHVEMGKTSTEEARKTNKNVRVSG